MTELPRIETSDPGQALSASLSLAPADTWHGIELVTALVRNTLLHIQLHRTPA